jgi:acetyl-CoA carboxylase biotin carboxyl carrier protein
VETARLKELIELMDRNQLEELEVVDGEQRIRLRKRPEPSREVVTMTSVAPQAGVAVGAAGDEAASSSEPAVDPAKAIQSPMVGTFFRSPGPDAEPFVEIGDQVQEGQVLCIVEAMKVMNEVKSDRAGVVDSVMVVDGTAVEFGQPLFLFS